MGKENDADADAMMETARARAAHERGVNVKMISTARPATAEVEMDASEALMKRDGKDVYKKSTAKKARYAMLFPGQLSAIKEGKIGEMREMHTQSPVVYLDFGVGRMKLLGSIVRPTSTRYFTLNAKSKDRMNLEEWFDSVIVFPSWYWIGTREENPEEKPLPMPEALGDLAGAAETDWRASVAAETSGKPSKETTTATKGATAAMDAKENAANDANGGRRPRRQAATAARKKMYADDSGAEEESDDDDGRVMSPVVVRGKVESFMPALSPVKPPPVRPSVDVPSRPSASAPSRPSASAPSRPSASAQKTTKEPPAKRQKKEPVIVIDSDDDDDDEKDEDSDDDDDEMELDDESEGESESEEEDDDSDFE